MEIRRSSRARAFSGDLEIILNLIKLDLGAFTFIERLCTSSSFSRSLQYLRLQKRIQKCPLSCRNNKIIYGLDWHCLKTTMYPADPNCCFGFIKWRATAIPNHIGNNRYQNQTNNPLPPGSQCQKQIRGINITFNFLLFFRGSAVVLLVIKKLGQFYYQKWRYGLPQNKSRL